MHCGVGEEGQEGHIQGLSRKNSFGVSERRFPYSESVSKRVTDTQLPSESYCQNSRTTRLSVG
jgi:hypothetical protein